MIRMDPVHFRFYRLWYKTHCKSGGFDYLLRHERRLPAKEPHSRFILF
jgi:hypothetical protein